MKGLTNAVLDKIWGAWKYQNAFRSIVISVFKVLITDKVFYWHILMAVFPQIHVYLPL